MPDVRQLDTSSAQRAWLRARSVPALLRVSLQASLLAPIWLAGCGAEAPTLDPVPLATSCACAGAACPTSVCDVSIELEAATCGALVNKVELMIDDQLEPTIWVPGDILHSCATIPRGAKATMVARSDTGWAWEDPLECPVADAGDTQGPTITRVLHCVVGP